MLSSCGINNVILMGRLTADPELRQTPSGVSTCQITVAVTRSYQNQNGERQSDFITVVAWRQTAEFICRYFSKGRLILVEGELRTRTYDDTRHPEVRHYVTEVYANNVSFGDSKGNSGGGNQQGGNNNFNAPRNNGSNQNDQSAPPPVNVGDLEDFQEVISDSDLPF